MKDIITLTIGINLGTVLSELILNAIGRDAKLGGISFGGVSATGGGGGLGR